MYIPILQMRVRQYLKSKVVTLYPGVYNFVCPCGKGLYWGGREYRTNYKAGIYCLYCKQETGRYIKMENPTIEFSHNWNNKLNCTAFTSLRLYNPVKYALGVEYTVLLRGVVKGKAKLIGAKSFYIDKINDYIARLDTGYDTDECKKLLRDMYKAKQVDWNTQRLMLLLFQYVKEQPKTLFDE